MFRILRYALVFTKNLTCFKDISVLKTKFKCVISFSIRQSLFLYSCSETSGFVLNAYCFMIYFYFCFIVSLSFIPTVCWRLLTVLKPIRLVPLPKLQEKINTLFTGLGRSILGKTVPSVLSTALGRSGTVFPYTDLPAGE